MVTMKFLKQIVIVSAMLFVLAGCSSEAKTNTSTSVSKVTTEKKNDGELAPNFNLKDVKGKSHSLSDYKGKKVYVKFWASWCPICLSGLEELNTLAGEDQDFVVLSVVSPGYNNEKEKASFIKWFNGVENTSNITVLLDEDGELAQELNVRGYPTSAYIGSDGVLIKTLPGHVSNDQIKEGFKSIQ